jgi:hypothetical protein
VRRDDTLAFIARIPPRLRARSSRSSGHCERPRACAGTMMTRARKTTAIRERPPTAKPTRLVDTDRAITPGPRARTTPTAGGGSSQRRERPRRTPREKPREKALRKSSSDATAQTSSTVSPSGAVARRTSASFVPVSASKIASSVPSVGAPTSPPTGRLRAPSRNASTAATVHTQV